MPSITHAQNVKEILKAGKISGSLQTDSQIYFEDSVINAPDVEESLLSNTFLQLTYQNGGLTIGMRFEAYMNPLLGFDPRYQGIGVPYRFASYKGDKFEITAGNFYEQFGSGQVLRAYQEWMLGVDNSIDGVRIKYNPIKGLYLKGLIGKQRLYWERGEGIVRGLDAEAYLSDLFPKLADSKVRVMLGGSFVSTFQKDNDPLLNLPENVAAFSGRTELRYKKFNLYGEYAYKVNDPSASNRLNYNSGSAIYLRGAYSRKGLSVIFAAKRIDNMNFRSDRNATINDATLSFLPAITKAHTYRLPTLYPYATQPNGEIGGQIDVIYKIPKGSKLGGKYGTKIHLNYARINGIDTTHVISGRTYEVPFFGEFRKNYFQDFNVEISRKFNKKYTGILKYINLTYDKNVIELGAPNLGADTVKAHIIIHEGRYKFNRKHSLRWELQHMSTKEDLGSWAMALLEYSISPHWFFNLSDEWNYGNPDEGRRVHYYNVGFAYILKANRLSLSYGKQRAGLLCVGGICRVVPASNGFTFSYSTSF